MYKALIRPILFALSEGDAEKAHDLAKSTIKKIQRVPPLLKLIGFMYKASRNPYPTKVCGITFPNRIGLAAGMDKNAEMLPFWQALGFGFVEVGSVLPFPQMGSPRPRLFRLPTQEALINRMGFNSSGVGQVVDNLRQVRKRIRIPVIGSMGKMKNTSLDDAADDYTNVVWLLHDFVDALTVNISSPNTPGLRNLQGKEYLEVLVRDVVDEATPAEGLKKPVFVKLAPDLSQQELEESYRAAMAGGASGFIISNTTTTRPFGPSAPKVASEVGGLSGPPVFPLMIERLKWLRRLDQNVPVVAVGGINHVDRGQEAFDEGASLIQILTGLVFEGPPLVSGLRRL